jgi:hypothetical protein
MRTSGVCSNGAGRHRFDFVKRLRSFHDFGCGRMYQQPMRYEAKRSIADKELHLLLPDGMFSAIPQVTALIWAASTRLLNCTARGAACLVTLSHGAFYVPPWRSNHRVQIASQLCATIDGMAFQRLFACVTPGLGNQANAISRTRDVAKRRCNSHILSLRLFIGFWTL